MSLITLDLDAHELTVLQSALRHEGVFGNTSRDRALAQAIGEKVGRAVEVVIAREGSGYEEVASGN